MVSTIGIVSLSSGIIGEDFVNWGSNVSGIWDSILSFCPIR